MISVVIPTLNAGEGLAATLTALVPAAVDGIVREVVIVDGGSTDVTARIAEEAGAVLVRSPPGRGTQLREGARQARCDWLLFLHADTVLQSGWEREVSALISRIECGAREPTAATFKFALDDIGMKPRMLEAMVGLRCLFFRFPYGDQGLLIPRRLYEGIGGFRDMPLMEDVDIVRRLGRRRLVLMRSRAVTSAARYRKDGYSLRIARNLSCLLLYYLRVPMRHIRRLYG
ncbi:MAG: glycosyltransferase [Hyphomicrobiaceae bacterium]|nr:MAG: glycosyltransferase [Hyphomicrobiaceae bacterium]